MVFVTPHTIRASHTFVVYLDLGESFLHTAIVFAPPGRTRREAWHRFRCQKVLLDIAVLLRAAILNASGDSFHWVIRFWTRRVIEGVFRSGLSGPPQGLPWRPSHVRPHRPL